MVPCGSALLRSTPQCIIQDQWDVMNTALILAVIVVFYVYFW